MIVMLPFFKSLFFCLKRGIKIDSNRFVMSKRRDQSPDENEYYTARKRRHLYTITGSQTEENIALFNRIVTEGIQQLPSRITKYSGTIFRQKKVTTHPWRVSFHDQQGVRHTRYFVTREEAEEGLKRANVTHRLPVANVIYLYNDQYYCVLTAGLVMKFSLDSIDVVEWYTWVAHYDNSVSSKYHAACYIRDENKHRQCMRFNRLVSSADGDTQVEYMNGDTLDNNLTNMSVRHLVRRD